MKKKLPQDMSEQELVFTLLANKVGAVDPKDVFYSKQITSGQKTGQYACMLGGKKLTANQVSNLKAEAATFQSMALYKVFIDTLTHEAKLRMFKMAKNERDMDWGKSILHAVGVMEAIVTSIRNSEVEQ